MCAIHKRIDRDITKLLNIFEDSKSFNKEIRIHIDEAHAYVPCHRDRLIEINNIDIVEKIYFYSATPFNIWQENYMKCNSLFKNIYIINIDEQYSIRKSKDYFGVKDCNHIISDYQENNNSDLVIPTDFIIKYGDRKQLIKSENNEDNLWYKKRFSN